MQSIRVLQTCALGNGTRQPGERLGTHQGPQTSEQILGLAWNQRRVPAGVVPEPGVTPEELLTALRNPHLIQFVADDGDSSAADRSVEEAIAELESHSPLAAAADDEPETTKKRKR